MIPSRACAALLLLALGPLACLAPAYAGGDGVEPSSEDPADGPPFFGDATDIKTRKFLADALVRAEFGKGQVILTHTDPEGRFRFGAFGAAVNPDSVKINCVMKGYKLVDVLRRPGPAADAPIEVQCLLEPE